MKAETFVALQNLVSEIHTDNVLKGFWNNDRNDGECLMLVVTELAEALEALRHGNPADQHCPEFTSLEIEIADAIIRLFDYAGGRNLRLADAIATKLAFNRSRPPKHGKAF